MARRLADDLERFIADVTLYLTSARVLQASAHAHSATWDLAKPSHDAAKKLLADGRPVAEALEACGGSASSVLAILHHVEGGGGADGGAAADAIRPFWREWKVELQRTAMRLRRGERLSGAGSKVPRRRRKMPPKPRPLTAKQVEAMQLFGECKGNFTEAARRAGVVPNSFRERYIAACTKLGKRTIRTPKPKTVKLTEDRRGQCATAAPPEGSEGTD